MRVAGVGLGQLVLALDATLVSLVEAPRAWICRRARRRWIDSDDVRLGLSRGPVRLVMFFLLRGPRRRRHPLDRPAERGARAARGDLRQGTLRRRGGPGSGRRRRGGGRGAQGSAGSGCISWSTTSSSTTATGPTRCPDSGTDLFALAQSIAERTLRHGQHRGRASRTCSRTRPPATRPTSCAGCRSWPRRAARAPAVDRTVGIFDILRAGSEVVWVDERPELGLRPRLAIGIHRTDGQRGSSGTAGRLTLQAPSGCSRVRVRWPTTPRRLLRGAAVLAARDHDDRLAARSVGAPAAGAAGRSGLAGRDGVDTETLARSSVSVTDGRRRGHRIRQPRPSSPARRGAGL